MKNKVSVDILVHVSLEAVMNIYIDLFNGVFVSMIVGHGQNALSWLSINLSVVI